MSDNLLKKILESKRNLIKKKRIEFDALKQKTLGTHSSRYHLFKKSISRPGQINLIAEIKKASPSQGLLCRNFDVMQLAKTYVECGASAISVLTEESFFMGKFAYLQQVSENFQVPTLMKDFIIDEGQIYEGANYGASAILLIVAILDDTQLKHLMQVAKSLDLDCLVEIHDEKELERALKADAEIIGINNRDLRTFHVDIGVSVRLIPRIPKGKIIVAESGLKTHTDVLHLQNLGAHAVLIGETFLREQDVGKKVRELMEGRVP